MTVDHSPTSDPFCPFWLAPRYHHALFADALDELKRGFVNIADWRLARHSFAESMRLLRDYAVKSKPRIHHGHADKHQAIWEMMSRYMPQVIVEVAHLTV